MADVEITCGDGRPLAEFTKLLEERGKWLHETAEQSCSACMIDVLLSLRALTVVAAPRKIEVELNMYPTTLVPSCTGGRKHPRFCLRQGRARYTPKANERIRRVTEDLKNCSVWRWLDIKDREWLIVAHNKAEAEKWAFAKVKKRAERFKGLAKNAMSLMMKKSGSVTAKVTQDNPSATSKADMLTDVTKTVSGNTCQIEAHDLLDYARLAMIDADNAINMALMKASNKIASIINTKCKNLLFFQKLDTPFPEVRKAR